MLNSKKSYPLFRLWDYARAHRRAMVLAWLINLRPSSNHFRRTNNRLFIFAFALILLFFISGCGILKSAQLRELETLISVIQPASGREVSRFVRDTEAGFTGPIYARIRIEFEPIDDYTKNDVYDEIVEILEKNNWEGETCDACTTDYFSASLHQENYPIPIRASVLVRADENLVSLKVEHPKP